MSTGFCSIISQESEYGIDLENFDTFSVKVRSDGRPYILNIKPEGWLPRDYYQGILKFPADQWVEAYVRYSFDNISCANLFSVANEQIFADGKRWTPSSSSKDNGRSCYFISKSFLL